VFEFVNGTSLTKTSSNITDDNDVRIFSYRLLKAVSELHDYGIIHNDLKGANILLNHENKKLKLIDFGLSYMYNPQLIRTSTGGTVNYKAPEQLINQGFNHHFTPAIDVHATGVLIAHLMYKKFHYLQLTQFERITAKEALKHKYFDPIRNLVE
ncbi:protein kinase domain protein, partial [Ichthyophthirius multifiliis]